MKHYFILHTTIIIYESEDLSEVSESLAIGSHLSPTDDYIRIL